jgi:quercetin dioxygenase-like cupin family protein
MTTERPTCHPLELVDGIGRVGGTELRLERHVLDGPGTVTRHHGLHEQLVVVLRGSGRLCHDLDEVPVGPGDVVTVPAHTVAELRLDGPAELLVVRRAGDEHPIGHEPSHWFG